MKIATKTLSKIIYWEKRLIILKGNLSEASNGAEDGLMFIKVMAVGGLQNVPLLESLVTSLMPQPHSLCHCHPIRGLKRGTVDICCSFSFVAFISLDTLSWW